MALALDDLFARGWNINSTQIFGGKRGGNKFGAFFGGKRGGTLNSTQLTLHFALCTLHFAYALN